MIIIFSALAGFLVSFVALGEVANDQKRLEIIKTIGGSISPKSVVASNTGLIFAQNMMYRHSITIYDSDGNLLKTLPDSVDLSSFGVLGHPGISRGAPVEAAFTPDGAKAYVSNYTMTGVGFGGEGSDSCTPQSARASGVKNSYVYRIDAKTLSIDQVIEVGLVPKYVAVSADGRLLLVTNWCSFDLNIIDTAQGKVIATLDIGRHPRGIAISKDSRIAYIAIMGESKVVKVNLATNTVMGSIRVGPSPRHLVLSPSGQELYATLNIPGNVVKISLLNEKITHTVHTGQGARSMATSSDGSSLYVVNYLSNTVSKLRTADMTVLQTIPTGPRPIGISYDQTTHNVWVAVYSGQIIVLGERLKPLDRALTKPGQP